MADVHVMLAVALVAVTVAAELIAADPDLGRVVYLGAGYLGLEVLIAASFAGRRALVPVLRLALALSFVTAVSLVSGGLNARPMGVLYLPVVTLAAAIGGREALVIGGAALAVFLVPRVVDPTESLVVLERSVIIAGTAIFLALGTRRAISSLERARDRARQAMTEDRRRGRQLAGLEAVGRLLAHAGATPDALDQVMEVLQSRFGYDHPSIYFRDGNVMRLGAQRGYPEPIAEIPVSVGVVGRVMRTGEAALLRDVKADPDYMSADARIESEVSVPVRIGDEVVGVLNVESTSARRLDETDAASLTLVADRVASALELARERETLARRAELFERLTTVSARLSESLEPGTVAETIAQAFFDVVAVDHAVTITLDPADGEYRMTAQIGGDRRFVGVRVQPGEGMAGRAIAERRLIVDDNFERSRFPAAMQTVKIDRVGAAAVPLIYDDDVVGAVSLARRDPSRRFEPLELEVLPLLAAQAAVAIRNAHLMTTIREASVRDPLTGLYNRRHFDASVERLIASQRRLSHDQRRPVSAILFDLDHFGALNKRHGHAAGDAVLRAFAGLLRDRFRASDIVARFGGEEFVVILDGATRDDAVTIAESVRTALADLAIHAPGGVTLNATVSAGCAMLADDAVSAAGLLEVADVGLVMAKQAGRNQVVAA
jgi:diguanylate cyclase (GGDEF)-like protein